MPTPGSCIVFSLCVLDMVPSPDSWRSGDARCDVYKTKKRIIYVYKNIATIRVESITV